MRRRRVLGHPDGLAVGRPAAEAPADSHALAGAFRVRGNPVVRGNNFGRSGVIQGVRFSALFTWFRPALAAAHSVWPRTGELVCPREARYSPGPGLPEGAARRRSGL